jgi:hypothetical protein
VGERWDEPTKSNLKLCPSHIAQLDPSEVITVNAGCSRYLLDRDWRTNGVAVEMWPKDRNGVNKRSRFGLLLAVGC